MYGCQLLCGLINRTVQSRLGQWEELFSKSPNEAELAFRLASLAASPMNRKAVMHKECGAELHVSPIAVDSATRL